MPVEVVVVPSEQVVVAPAAGAAGVCAGAAGAAARLGMPGSTLESKIRVLNIDKKRFKA